jgi:uncharacterized protein
MTAAFRGAFLTVLLAASLATPALALDTTKLQPRGYVNDFANALDPGGAQQLDAYCTSLERATGVQMAIVVVDSLEGEPSTDVGNRLFRQWGIGKKGKDDGILLMLAVKDRKQDVEVGYGLEGTISDVYAGSVLRGIRPILRQGNYAGALLAAAQQFGSRVAEEKGVALDSGTPIRTERRVPQSGGGGFNPIPLLIIGFILFAIIKRIFGGRGGGGGYGGGGGGTGFITGMILGNLLGGGRRGGWGGGGFGGFDGGGGGGGFGGGGGGGFGGFGGGSSGGGGASSDW